MLGVHASFQPLRLWGVGEYCSKVWAVCHDWYISTHLQISYASYTHQQRQSELRLGYKPATPQRQQSELYLGYIPAMHQLRSIMRIRLVMQGRVPRLIYTPAAPQLGSGYASAMPQLRASGILCMGLVVQRCLPQLVRLHSSYTSAEHASGVTRI